MTVLIEDRESDTERDVCQILEMFSHILLDVCISAVPYYFWSQNSAVLIEDFIFSTANKLHLHGC